MMPMFFPLAFVTGMMASTPNCMARPDDRGIYRADRLLAVAVGDRGDEIEFDQRGQAFDPFRQAEIVNIGAQVEVTVFDRKAVVYRIRNVVDGEGGDPGIGIDHRARGLLARCYAVTDRTGKRKGARPV